MATSRRRQSTAVIEQLHQTPWEFSFVQAVRVLESAALAAGGDVHEVGGEAAPANETLHFVLNPALNFAASEIDEVADLSNEKQARWQVRSSFLSLVGGRGALPHYYSEHILQRLRRKDDALYAFLNILGHRTLSLYLKAWRKYRLAFGFEEARRHPTRQKRDAAGHFLLSLLGLGTEHLHHRQHIEDDMLVGFAGYFSRSNRSASGLQALLHHLFGLRVRVHQFQGQWQTVVTDALTRVGSQPATSLNNQLGESAMLGQTCWYAQSKFTVEIEQLPYAQFMRLAPHTQRFKTLKDVIRFYVGAELDFDILLSIPRRQIPPLQLQRAEHYQPLLGWNSRLGTAKEHPGHVIHVTLSGSMQT